MVTANSGINTTSKFAVRLPLPVSEEETSVDGAGERIGKGGRRLVEAVGQFEAVRNLETVH